MSGLTTTTYIVSDGQAVVFKGPNLIKQCIVILLLFRMNERSSLRLTWVIKQSLRLVILDNAPPIQEDNPGSAEIRTGSERSCVLDIPIGITFERSP